MTCDWRASDVRISSDETRGRADRPGGTWIPSEWLVSEVLPLSSSEAKSVPRTLNEHDTARSLPSSIRRYVVTHAFRLKTSERVRRDGYKKLFIQRFLLKLQDLKIKGGVNRKYRNEWLVEKTKLCFIRKVIKLINENEVIFFYHPGSRFSLDFILIKNFIDLFHLILKHSHEWARVSTSNFFTNTKCNLIIISSMFRINSLLWLYERTYIIFKVWHIIFRSGHSPWVAHSALCATANSDNTVSGKWASVTARRCGAWRETRPWSPARTVCSHSR